MMKTYKLPDCMDFPLAALSSSSHTRGDQARSDELKGDKKGLRVGGGSKKVKEGGKQG